MLGLPLLLAVLVGAWVRSRGHRAAPRTPPELQDWDINDLAEHLRGAGLPLREVATAEDGDARNSAYLTTTASTWDELARLARVPERRAGWEGTVYCERNTRESDRKLCRHLWGECYLCAGPFLFFGDPELLGRIRAVLGGTPG
jgi:hypothetical protein